MRADKFLSEKFGSRTKAAEAIENGNRVEADLDAGIIYDRTTGKSFQTQPFPPFIQKIIENGGLVASIQKGDIG